MKYQSAFERDRCEGAGLGLPSPATNAGMTLFRATVVLLLFPLVAFGVITFRRNLPAELPPLSWAEASALTQSLDNGYLVALGANKRINKESLSPGTALLELDSFGNVERVINFYERLFLHRIEVAADSNYLLGGVFDEVTGARGVMDAVIVKVKAHNGVIIWRYNYSGPLIDCINSVSPTPDGGCFATGRFSSDTIPPYCFLLGVVRLKSNGTPVWERIFRFPLGGRGAGYAGADVLPMPDGGCVVSSHFEYWRGEEEWSPPCLYVMRLNPFGDPMWSAIYIPHCRVRDWGYFEADLFFTPSGNIAVCGTYADDNADGIPYGFVAGYLKVFTPDGEEILDKLVMVRRCEPPLPMVTFREGESTPNGGFVLYGEETPGGRITPRPCILGLNEKGDSIWCRIYVDGGFPAFGRDRFISTYDGGYCAMTTAEFAPKVIHLIKTDSVGMVHWEKTPVQTGKSSHQLEIGEGDTNLIFPLLDVSPNPFTKTATIRYQLPSASPVRILAFDITGRTVATLFDQNQPAGTHQLIWQPEGLAQGIYFIKLQLPGSSFTQRCLYLHQE